MKKESGMGHIMLIICVIAIIAIIVFAVNFFLNEANKRKEENIITDMLILQGKIKVIAQENEMNKEENTLVGKQVKENLEDEKIKTLLEQNIINQEAEDFENYYIINSEDLKQLNLNDDLEDEYYIVNYKNYEIIYSKGIEIEEKTYYTLTELKELKEGRPFFEKNG